jgi:hypothetical protein
LVENNKLYPHTLIRGINQLSPQSVSKLIGPAIQHSSSRSESHQKISEQASPRTNHGNEDSIASIRTRRIMACRLGEFTCRRGGELTRIRRTSTQYVPPGEVNR